MSVLELTVSDVPVTTITAPIQTELEISPLFLVSLSDRHNSQAKRWLLYISKKWLEETAKLNGAAFYSYLTEIHTELKTLHHEERLPLRNGDEAECFKLGFGTTMDAESIIKALRKLECFSR